MFMGNSRRAAMAVCAALALAGCETTNAFQQASYATIVEGKFEETGKFVADLGFVLNPADGSFKGEMRNFQFTEPGLDRPTGTIPISGVTSRNDQGDIEYEATGKGVLQQGNKKFDVELQMGTTYVNKYDNTAGGWYWAGGSVTRNGAYQKYSSFQGQFTAKLVCKPGPLKPGPCPLPPPRKTASGG